MHTPAQRLPRPALHPDWGIRLLTPWPAAAHRAAHRPLTGRSRPQANDNGDGKIDFEEFGRVLRLLNIHLPPSAARQAFATLDADGSGAIGFDEFCAGARRLAQKPSFLEPSLPPTPLSGCACDTDPGLRSWTGTGLVQDHAAVSLHGDLGDTHANTMRQRAEARCAGDPPAATVTSVLLVWARVVRV